MKHVQFSDKTGEIKPSDARRKGQEDMPDVKTSEPKPKARVSTKEEKKKSAPGIDTTFIPPKNGDDENMSHSEPVVKAKKPLISPAVSAEIDSLVNHLLEAASQRSEDKLKAALEMMERSGLRFDQRPLSGHEKLKKFKQEIVIDLLKGEQGVISEKVADLVSQLVILGCDVNGVDQDGNTTLMLGCRAGRVDVVKALLAQCPTATLHAVNYHGRNAAMVASEAGNKHLLLALHKAGVSHRPQNPAIVFYTLVQYAKNEPDYRRRISEVLMLVKQGDYLNLVDESGKTLLMHAACLGDLDMIEALVKLDQQPMIHIRDIDGKDVIDHAKNLDDENLGKRIITTILDSME